MRRRRDARKEVVEKSTRKLAANKGGGGRKVISVAAKDVTAQPGLQGLLERFCQTVSFGVGILPVPLAFKSPH